MFLLFITTYFLLALSDQFLDTAINGINLIVEPIKQVKHNKPSWEKKPAPLVNFYSPNLQIMRLMWS